MNRRFRLIAALGTAVILTMSMMYVGLASSDVQEPVLQAGELVSRAELAASRTVQVDGIAAGPVRGEPGERMRFWLVDRDGRNRTQVTYEGSVPDAFRVGRNVIVTGRLRESSGDGRVFVAHPGSLVTKCPSKFESGGGSDRSSA